jgi:hypothetical protein
VEKRKRASKITILEVLRRTALEEGRGWLEAVRCSVAFSASLG